MNIKMAFATWKTKTRRALSQSDPFLGQLVLNQKEEHQRKVLEPVREQRKEVKRIKVKLLARN
jgi:hypothetical protein